MLKNGISELKSANMDVVDNSPDIETSYRAIYGENIFRSDSFKHIFFVRIKNERYIFKVFDIAMIKDKRYLKLLTEMNKFFRVMLKA